MHESHRQLQRYLDGELDIESARSIEALLATDEALRRQASRLERLEGDFRSVGRQGREPEEHLGAILARLPAGRPIRQGGYRLVELVTAASLMISIWMVYAIMAQLPGLMPLSMVMMGSLVVGALFMLLAEPLRYAEVGLLSRLLRQRLSVGQADVLVVRAAGLAIILGAIWYKTHHVVTLN
jgi:anti-sigma factor RsiW